MRRTLWITMLGAVCGYGTACSKPMPQPKPETVANSFGQDVMADPEFEPTQLDGRPKDAPKVTVRLGKIPDLKPESPQAVTAEEESKIRRLIDDLAKIENPDYGLSPTMSGDAFLPIEGMGHAGVMLLTNHQLKTSAGLKRLVELGPKALPLLLKSLDNQMPTKLKMAHEGISGGMWFANELFGNPVNPIEVRTLGQRPRFPDSDEEHITSYTVKVGDVCLVAIGQIVGRPYQAVRYQPSGCTVINSPAHDAKLRQQVREMWSSDNPTQMLFDSLLLDYSTEGIFNGNSLDGWDDGAEFQTHAAMRLLYYFPRESAQLLADRLDRLNVGATGPGSGSPANEQQLDDSMKQDLANGVRVNEFVKAIAWSRESLIKDAMYRLFQRATDIDVVLESLRSLGAEHTEEIRERLGQMLAALPEEEGGPFGDGFNTLIALGKYGAPEAKPVFVKYLSVKTVQRCRSMCHALRQTRKEWAIELLNTLLADRRDTGWAYAVTPGMNEPRLPIRVCDEAAVTIAHSNGELKYEMKGSHQELDQQIELMQRQISK